jgi:Tol biopolymer transport system component
MKADGTEVVRLTNNRLDELEPSWSPNGKKIAFTGGFRNDYAIGRYKSRWHWTRAHHGQQCRRIQPRVGTASMTWRNGKISCTG